MEAKDLKLLVIEDEPIIRESYIDMFSVLGYQTDTAVNGKDGLHKLSQKDYHLVITDLNMPVMDGQETLRRIKKKYPNVEVIVVTGFATIETAINAMKEGAFDYITKPVSLEHVRIVLNRCRKHISASHENEELKNLNHQLKHVNEIKDKFITITNHELRTPLAVLKGYFELIDLSIEDKSEEITEYLGIVSSTLYEMIELVERMHNLSDAEKAFSRKENTTFNLNDSILSVASEMKILFKKREIEFGAYTNSKVILISADKNNLHRAIRELLQNALKFTEKGGKVSLKVKKEAADRKVYISVEDNGIGIPLDKQNFVFEPFYEVQDVMHHSTSQTDFMGGGIGVGLSLVKEILQTCDGKIEVHSEEGKGSVFTIILPEVEKMEEALVS
ncbi:MAG: hybrid sensor histidine kinase/response regulator [Calditrichaeota bacterium]|nr:MAG: response regulator [Calditrichota bacterium]MBL1204717.1 hybrid sensor histidine kinase/response regulator [Calditrichota bacterium]NOG44545.1 response regulator [Calditrichota bacterium]